MMINSNEIMLFKLDDCELICHNAKDQFQYKFDLIVQRLGKQGYTTADSIEICENFDQLTRELLIYLTSPFPKLLKLEMICYHIQLLREHVITALKG